MGKVEGPFRPERPKSAPRPWEPWRNHVELRVDVVEPCQKREPPVQQLLLEPGFEELPVVRRLDVAHTLEVADVPAGLAAETPEAVQEDPAAVPAHELLELHGEEQIEVSEHLRAPTETARRDVLGR